MDDEEHILDFAKETLENFGCIVETAKNGEEAIKKFEKDKYDIVIMDLTIKGGMGAKSTVKKILRINSGAKVIISSGYTSGEVIDNYKGYGFKGKLIKPFTIEQLKEALLAIL
jgi:DNA-binding NtrC family response regulator